tara:strand:+ start:121 stop:411 length:291 start_codon:yes stop_codon:yes gene_type:complete
MNKIFIQTYNVMKGEIMKHYLLIAILGLVACEDSVTAPTDAVTTTTPTVVETTETVTTTNDKIKEEVTIDAANTNKKVITENDDDVNKGDNTNEND